MKKILFLLAMLPMIVFTACSSDDDDEVKVSESFIVGQWDVYWAEQNGESMDIPSGLININLKSSGSYSVNFLDNYYVGEWELSGTTVTGTTVDGIKEWFKFTEMNGNKGTIDYSNSEGDKYKFKATKK